MLLMLVIYGCHLNMETHGSQNHGQVWPVLPGAVCGLTEQTYITAPAQTSTYSTSRHPHGAPKHGQVWPVLAGAVCGLTGQTYITAPAQISTYCLQHEKTTSHSP